MRHTFKHVPCVPGFRKMHSIVAFSYWKEWFENVRGLHPPGSRLPMLTAWRRGWELYHPVKLLPSEELYRQGSCH